MRAYRPVFTVLITALLSSTSYSAERFTIIIDAGSTGSKLHVFQYDDSSSVPEIKDLLSESVKPGISSFADHPENVGESLKKLLDDATQVIQKNNTDVKTTDINILATAGMRLLPEDKQKAIYANLVNYIKCNYQFHIATIDTISGKMEGLYSWLDINYLQGNFQMLQPTVGTIDMGGASTQIAFATSDESHPEDEVELNLNNKRYIVFSKSFLGFGQDQVRDKMISTESANSCFPKNYLFAKERIGDFNLSACEFDYANIIRAQKIDQQVISTQDQPFIAYSGIYFTYNFFNSDKTPDQFSFETSLQKVCGKTWEQLKQSYPDIQEKYLSAYCANGVYNDELIYNTYKIKGSQLTVINQINNKEIDWTLGALLYGLNDSNLK